MACQDIVKMGNENLNMPSLPITQFNTHELNKLIQDLKDTMAKEQGVGIAAPQIGCYQRVVIFGFEHNDRYPDQPAIPLTILINPTIEILSPEMEDGWEGCLSVPGLRGLVPRYKTIKYSAFDSMGKPFSNIVEGFHARVVQHECDHLDGILYPQRIKDLRFFGFQDEILNRQFSIETA
jgi:peptide deformylase